MQALYQHQHPHESESLDLTTTDVNGTLWDVSKIRMQNRALDYQKDVHLMHQNRVGHHHKLKCIVNSCAHCKSNKDCAMWMNKNQDRNDSTHRALYSSKNETMH